MNIVLKYLSAQLVQNVLFVKNIRIYVCSYTYTFAESVDVTINASYVTYICLPRVSFILKQIGNNAWAPNFILIENQKCYLIILELRQKIKLTMFKQNYYLLPTKVVQFYKAVQKRINHFSNMLNNIPLLHSKSIIMYPFEHMHFECWHNLACSLPVHWVSWLQNPPTGIFSWMIKIICIYI